MTITDVNAALDAVAPRLRRLRQDSGMTLAEVSKATQISVSTLSRLESGQRKPSLDLLLPLARTYQIPLDDLVKPDAPTDPRVIERPVRRHGHIFIPLSKHQGGTQAFKVISPGRKKKPKVEFKTHEGYEWVYILAGTLELHLGEEVLELEAGQAAEFDTMVPHFLVSANEHPVEMLSLFSPQGERMHVHNE